MKKNDYFLMKCVSIEKLGCLTDFFKDYEHRTLTEEQNYNSNNELEITKLASLLTTTLRRDDLV